MYSLINSIKKALDLCNHSRMQPKTASKGIIQWVLTFFSIISQTSEIRLSEGEPYRQNEVGLKKALKILLIYLSEYSWAL